MAKKIEQKELSLQELINKKNEEIKKLIKQQVKSNQTKPVSLMDCIKTSREQGFQPEQTISSILRQKQREAVVKQNNLEQINTGE